jgi:membrane associated rhomboid family serine protease
LTDHDELGPDGRPRRLVHHAPLKRWSPISREERRRTRAFVRRLTEFPYLTLGLVVFLSWGYVVQLILGWPFTVFLPPSAPGDALLTEALGAQLGWLDAEAVRSGEGWRLVSATLLHGSLLHVVGNCAVLYLLGRIVENVYGRAAFLVAYVGAGVAGTGLSVIVSGNNSLGASGAILGMLGASLALGIRYKHQIPKPLRDYFGTDLWVFVLLVAAMSLLPFVDWAGHLGGFLWGLGVGLVWPPEMLAGRPSPRGQAIGSALAGVALGGLVFTSMVVGQRIADLGEQLPADDLRAFAAAWERDDSDSLVRIAQRMSERYLDSPQMQYELGRVFLVAGEYSLAVEAFGRFERKAADRMPDERWQNDVAWAMFLAAPDDPETVADGLSRVRKALAEQSDSPPMRNTFAYGLLLDGDAARAEAISRELMGDKATDEERQVDAWIHIPALLALGEGDQALEEYHRFAAIFPAEPDLTLMDIAVLKERAEKELRIQGLLD